MWYKIEDFKVKATARAVLAYLEGEWQVRNVPDCHAYIHTAAWYNGREDGFSVTVSMSPEPESLVVTFGEHRNTDQIFVDHWLGRVGINPPTVDDFTDEAYEDRKMFKYDDAAGAAIYVRQLIEGYLRDVATETEN